ncbi:MAG: GNAT family N-acetyltransferase [Actinomycetota bacterium]
MRTHNVPGGTPRVETEASRAHCEHSGTLFYRVWGYRGMVPNEVIIATVHAGGSASLAGVGDALVGAGWGCLGAHDVEHYLHSPVMRTLHSHVTGVVPEYGSLGVGEALKRHQWLWAHEHALDAITWTFDPLVRRNAYFNLVKLGAIVTEYHEDFYGAISDGLNRGEHTDRLVVTWRVAGCGGTPPMGRHVDVAEWSVSTPEDVEALRVADRAAHGAADRASRHADAHAWRVRQRADLRKVFSGGWKIAGLMSDGSYAVVRA